MTDDATDVVEEEEPAAKSVPPRQPPSPIATTEHSLPSVMVDLRELEASDKIEAARSSDVDVLLADIEAHADVRDSRREQTHHSINVPPAAVASSSPWRGLAIAVVAVSLAGTTFAGLRAYYGTPHALGAALHLSR